MKIKLNGEDFFRVTSDFHAIDSMHANPHRGIDLATYEGTPLISATDGEVVNIFHLGNQNVGEGIKVQMEDGSQIIYGHLKEGSINVEVGDHVHIGEIIAQTGNTGRSSGPHLHVGAKDAGGNFVDPQQFVDTIQELAFQLLDIAWKTTLNLIDWIVYFL